MTSQRTVLDACLGLLALSALLAPNAMALGIDDVGPVDDALDGAGLALVTDAGCAGQGTTKLEYGSVSFNHLGTFPLRAIASNGCNGDGCDDSFTDAQTQSDPDRGFYSNGAWRPIAMSEDYQHHDSSTCKTSCLFVGAYNSYNGPGYGNIFVNVSTGKVEFECVKPDGEWLYRGYLSLASDCEEAHQRPACQ